ncbi:hypothetical protein [Synechocystis salina]|uniref:hypothetical protein n=1 Tax=Synechocystis salina TaxID=945780 RepID=UPI00187FA1E9|nr:hypothetical protein [Synechocystis salina]
MAVAVNTTLTYGFLTSDLSAIPGVSASDITAIGQTPLAGASGLVVFSPRSPKPAQFRKKLNSATQGSVTAYGDGTTAGNINRAAGAGWKMSKGVRRTSFGNTRTQTAIAVPVSNGLLVKRFVPNSDAGNASLLGWDVTMSGANLDKLVSAPQGAKLALVAQVGDNFTKTLPVASSKIADAIQAGWRLVQPESGFEPVDGD